MTEVVGVRFKSTGKVYYFDPDGFTIAPGQDVIVETARGLEFGECSLANTHVSDDTIVLPLRKVIRIATDEDRQTLQQNEEKQKEALLICQQKVEKHHLEMKFIDAEMTFDGSKMLFYFTAEGRVDFRELVRDLASVFRTRIELRQIGVRDEAKLLGGLGICGKPFCCATFLDDFQPVSIKMAKEQSLSLNPTKISGTCGRLMCCLKFEQDAYEDLRRNTPTPGTHVITIDGPGVVTEISNLLRGSLKVRLDSAPEVPKLYQKCEVALPGNEQTLRRAIKEEAPSISALFSSSFGSLSAPPTLFEGSSSKTKEQDPHEKDSIKSGPSIRKKENRSIQESAMQESPLNTQTSPAEPKENGTPEKRRSRRHRGSRGHGKRNKATSPVTAPTSSIPTSTPPKSPSPQNISSPATTSLDKKNTEHRSNSKRRRGRRGGRNNGNSQQNGNTNTKGSLPGGGYSKGYND